MTTRTVILNTRPAIYRDAMHEALAPLGVPVVDAPVLAPRPLATAVPHAEAFDTLIFTSQISVAFFPAADAWRAKMVYAVGEATAAAARRAGFARVIAAAGDARDLARILSRLGFGRALYPSAADVAAALDTIFAGRIVRVPIYRMTPTGGFDPEIVRRLRSADRIIAPFFSRRSTHAAAEALNAIAGAVEVAAVGISTAALDITVPAPWSVARIAREPSFAGVIDAIRGLIARTWCAVEAA